MDEPQLIVLRDRSVFFIALAIPDQDPLVAKFIAVTMTPRVFEAYLDGNVDLRYVFTFPRTRRIYHFDLMNMNEGKVMLGPHEGEVPEEHLPAPRIFSTEHTEEYRHHVEPADHEKLIIDGEWDMPEFGRFYGQFADIYYLIAATKTWKSPVTPIERKSTIANSFKDKPYRGGSSYKHFYNDLIYHSPRAERASLENINYASPGTVTLKGRDDLFSDVRGLIDRYLENRVVLITQYADLHGFLSRSHLLTLSGELFRANDPSARFIMAQTEQLANEMAFDDLPAVQALVDRNALVAAKIVLSLFRRVEAAAAFFAQGRMTYQ